MARSSKKAAKKKVKFGLRADAGSNVFVAGTFNNWDAKSNKMKRGKNGVYTTTMLLPPGRYEYKFVVNDVWCVDPECSEWTPNEHGSLNSVLVVQ